MITNYFLLVLTVFRCDCACHGPAEEKGNRVSVSELTRKYEPV